MLLETPLLNLVQRALDSKRIRMTRLCQVCKIGRGSMYALLSDRKHRPAMGTLQAIAEAVGAEIHISLPRTLPAALAARAPRKRLSPARPRPTYRTRISDAQVHHAWGSSGGDVEQCAILLKGRPAAVALRCIILGLMEPREERERMQAERLRRIWECRLAGRSYEDIAKLIGCSRVHVYNILATAAMPSIPRGRVGPGA